MKTTELNHFQTLFNSLRSEILEKLNNDFYENGFTNLTDLSSGDIVDQLTKEKDAKLKLKLQGRDQFFLKKIEHALVKIENETFGECEECSGEIGVKRLMARPIATHCINCKEEMERAEGHVLYQHRSKTNGKEITNIHNVNFTSDESAGEGRVVNTAKFGKQDNISRHAIS